MIPIHRIGNDGSRIEGAGTGVVWCSGVVSGIVALHHTLEYHRPTRLSNDTNVDE